MLSLATFAGARIPHSQATNLRVWLVGAVFDDSSPDLRVVNGFGTATANNSPAPVTYSLVKTDPFNVADLGSIGVAAAPELLFSSGDLLIQFYASDSVGSGDRILYQRGTSNGGFGSELTLFTDPNPPYGWILCIRGDDPGVQMLGVGSNTPPSRYAFLWDVGDIPTISSTEHHFRFRRAGKSIQASYDFGPWVNPNGIGAAELPSANFVIPTDAGATSITLVNRQNQAYTYSTRLREYQIWTASAGPGPTVYSYWNPDDKGTSVTLSVADSVASLPASDSGAVRGGIRRNISEDYYYELEILGADIQSMPGIGLSSASLSQFPGIDGNGFGYFGDGLKYTAGVGASYGAAYGAVVIGVRAHAGQVSFSVNGVDQGVAFSGLTGVYYPMWGAGTGGSGTRSAKLRVFASELSYLPSGSTPWAGG